MQILKDEVKERIQQAALREFSAKGFERSSIRSIARRAGIAAGNVYRYFRSKDDLFRVVVGPAYDEAVRLITQYGPPGNESSGDGSVFMEDIAELTARLYTEHRVELLILLDGSKGSVYESARQEVEKLLENRISKACNFVETTLIARVIAASFVEGFITILKECNEKPLIREMTKQFIGFYFKDILLRF